MKDFQSTYKEKGTSVLFAPRLPYDLKVQVAREEVPAVPKKTVPSKWRQVAKDLCKNNKMDLFYMALSAVGPVPMFTGGFLLMSSTWFGCFLDHKIKIKDVAFTLLGIGMAVTSVCGWQALDHERRIVRSPEGVPVVDTMGRLVLRESGPEKNRMLWWGGEEQKPVVQGVEPRTRQGGAIISVPFLVHQSLI